MPRQLGFSKSLIQQKPSTIAQCLATSGLCAKVLEGVIQKVYSQFNSVGLTRIVRDILPEFLPLSICLIGIFDADGRVQILLLSADPVSVGFNKRTYACGIKIFGA